MTTAPLRPAPTSHEIAAWLMAAAALFAVLHWHLLPALLAGLLVYELTHILAKHLPGSGSASNPRKVLAVVLLVSSVVILVVALIVGAVTFFRSDSGSLTTLLGKMAEILESSRDKLPAWLGEMLPSSPDGLKDGLALWLREHAAELQKAGKEAGHLAAHMLIGIVIGAMAAVREACDGQSSGPLALALSERIRRFADAFRSIVFAQVKISGMNTLFTAIYLVAALPLFGIHLPLAKTLIAVTFVAGLIPVLGNLISNLVIVVVSLSHSLEAAIASLVFLVVIHKLEYFLNARIVGAGVGAKAWELLLAMLIMESLFGIPGVVAAPIYYAYLKGELADRGLV